MGRFSGSDDDAVNEYYQAQRWVQQGIKEERERIINLLKKMQEGALITETDVGKTTAWALENAIALIKGDNK